MIQAKPFIYRRFSDADSTHNKACLKPVFTVEHGLRLEREVRVYPSVHYLHRQAAREKLAAQRALTEAARQRHLSLAADFQKRAEAMHSGIQP